MRKLLGIVGLIFLFAGVTPLTPILHGVYGMKGVPLANSNDAMNVLLMLSKPCFALLIIYFAFLNRETKDKIKYRVKGSIPREVVLLIRTGIFIILACVALWAMFLYHPRPHSFRDDCVKALRAIGKIALFIGAVWLLIRYIVRSFKKSKETSAGSYQQF